MGYPTIEELSHFGHSLWLLALGLLSALRRAARAHLEQRRAIPMEVLVKNRAQRRTIERDLQSGMRRLRRTLGAQFPTGAAVLVQQVICTDRQLAGCYQMARRPDGPDLALIRLALQVDGRQLLMDEMLSVLAEQCIGLAVHQTGGAGVLIPVELEAARRTEDRRVDALRADPLAPATTPTRTTGGQLTRVS
ncbi:MAG: hypothetical protein IT305_12900 [Chloroflexi bacterium]|nr:hypothetical protein [Chloroflexota bacterium]